MVWRERETTNRNTLMDFHLAKLVLKCKDKLKIPGNLVNDASVSL